ncbi:MAG: hypothetical protein ACT4TC_24685 [Myxococcaceae bacterium]
MLNRHAIVLFLGNAALLLVRPLTAAGGVLSSVPGVARFLPLPVYGALATGFLLTLVGLVLDDGKTGPRAQLAHLLQGAGVAFLILDAALLFPLGEPLLHLALAELGIGLAVLGVLVEMRAGYSRLRLAAGAQVLGDALYVAALIYGVLLRTGQPSTVGWVFIAIAGLLGLYAALSNLILQVARVRNPQAGWRFRVTGVDDVGMKVKTPSGEAQIAWRHVEAVQQLDARHLILVLPSPLPPEMSVAGLPMEELRTSTEGLVPETAPPPERYGFVLHEQELGRSLKDAEQLLQTHAAAAHNAGQAIAV